MKTTTIIASIAAAAAAIALVPALKGPFNRIRNTANEKLNDEFVVDNYKAEYVNLHEKKVELKKSLDKFNIEKKIANKKISAVSQQVFVAKQKLMSTGTSDLVAFNRAKDAYESFKIELDNLTTMVGVYSNAIAKLETSLALVESNMRKAKMNVDTLSSKKALVDTVKGVNSTLENLNGVGDAGLSMSIEKLDDDALRESIKLEALAESDQTKSTMTEADAKAYLDSLK